MTDRDETNKIINKAARDVIALARNTLLVNMRFLDPAIGRLEPVPSDDSTFATDGSHLIYGPRHVLKTFKAENEKPARDYLHVLMHCIYNHMFTGASVNRRLWDLACDIAVESTINDLGLRITDYQNKAAQTAEVEMLRSHVGVLTAERIYRYFCTEGIPENELERLSELFYADDHTCWYKDVQEAQGEDEAGSGHSGQDAAEKDLDDYEDALTDEDIGELQMAIAEAGKEWKAIAEKVQDALDTFFKEQGDSADVLMQNLRAVNRERYDYADFLRKFAVIGENPEVNDEEFDYILYTYGLKLYENMPLVEPLEYKEVKRIKEFVIAIDTSGSTSGELVQRFLQKTYNILKTSESYFSRVNIHIIQCDASIQEHVKITSEEEFDEYIKDMSIHGLGGTDFRPVFSFVDELVDAGEFTDLRGLIYFTDGYGTFPSAKPAYDTAFVFLDDEYSGSDFPPWAIRIVLESEDLRR